MSHQLTVNKEIGIMELRVHDSESREEVGEAMEAIDWLKD